MRILSALSAAAAAVRRPLGARLSGRARSTFQRSITVGVPTETKTLEARVGLTPSATREFIQQGHRVLVQADAGAGSGFRNEQYRDAGCELVTSASDVFAQSDMIVKVKEPLPHEYKMVRENQVVFTYFHFASSPELTDAMVKANAVCIAYETVQNPDRSLPLLVPMSEIAGRMATQEGAKYLEKPMGGRGVLLGGVPGTARGNVLVLGCGVVGTEAAKMAAGLGANVTLMDVNLDRLRYLDTVMPPNVSTRFSTPSNIAELLPEADLVIGAVLIAGKRAPHLICRHHLKTMKAGSVIVDVAVDQGGCIETCRPTTHDKPTFVVEDVLHYCVANMPGAVPITSTNALNNATLPFGLQLANEGWVAAARTNAALRSGLNIVNGTIVHPAVHSDYPLYPYMHVDEVLELRETSPAQQIEVSINGAEVPIEQIKTRH